MDRRLIVSTFFACMAMRVHSGVCPCAFDWLEGNTADVTCYASIPLIAGVNAKAKFVGEGKPETQATIPEIIEATCDEFSAHVLLVKVGEVKGKAGLAAKYSFNVFFYEEGGKHQCAFYYPNATLAKPMDCGLLLSAHRNVTHALCVDGPTEDTNVQCVCPCSFYWDNEYRCIRDYLLCQPINDSSDMISACSAAQIAPGVVARASSPNSVSNWPTETLFYIGESENDQNETDDVMCGFIANETLYHSNGTCAPWLAEMGDLLDANFVLALCVTPVVSVKERGDCGTPDDELLTDRQDCGAMDQFGQGGTRILMMSCIWGLMFYF